MAATADLAPGTVVGDYRVDHEIGAGGMGTVYQATQPIIGKRVALKVLHRKLCENATAVSRFVQEARAVNQIGHPNIVDVFGFGTTDDGRAFLVMELLVGESLAARAKRDPIPLAELCDILVEVAHALEAAHAAGIVHRDLKPDNVFLVARKGVPGVKLLDFGIAKLTSSGGRVEETQPGILIGTPRYISPEQVRGRPLDGSTDVYALGVVAFELMAGRAPFVAADPHELFEKHATLRPPKPSAFNAGLPAAADELIGAMLAKDQASRPTLAQIRDALAALRGAPVSELAPARVVASAQATEILGEVRSDIVTAPRLGVASHPRRWPLIVGAAAAVMAGVGVAAMMLGGSAHTDDDSAPAALIRRDTTPTAAGSGTAPIAPVESAPVESAVESAPVEIAPAEATRSPGPRATHTRHVRDKAIAKPVDKPVDKPIDKPVDKPIDKPRPVDDDDAVRSPFSHK